MLIKLDSIIQTCLCPGSRKKYVEQLGLGWNFWRCFPSLDDSKISIINAQEINYLSVALGAGCCLRPADRPAPDLTIDDLVALAASEYVAATQIMPTRDQTMIPIKTPIIARAL